MYKKADFSAIQKHHEQRFLYYLDFLQKNGLQTIFDEKGDAPDRSLFDEIIRNTSFAPPVKAFSTLSIEEQLDRLRGINRERKLPVNYQNYHPFIQEYSSQEI